MEAMAHILVVDDERTNLLILREFLENERYSVEMASGGREGLEAARERNPDLVLLDVFMPEMDGISVCRELKKDERTRHIPIIFMTAHETDEVRLAGLEAGANEFLSKPIHQTELLLRVRNMLQVRQYDAMRQQADLLEKTSDVLAAKNRELEEALDHLKQVQAQVIQQEKMASIGQLAAGIAHEINNPIGYVLSNLGTLGKYTEKIWTYIERTEQVLNELPDGVPLQKTVLQALLESHRKELKLDRIRQDLDELLRESVEGTQRMKQIVQDLKGFSRTNEKERKEADLNKGLDTTINVVWNELKYKASVEREYGDLPPVKCNLGQLNQVFMNLLVNAAHAIEKQGVIRVQTRHAGKDVYVSVSDTGSGIAPENLGRIFDPFFTTKEAGQGTGLGLAISYDIVKKHHGDISVQSAVGQGTTFTIRIPVQDHSG